MLVTCRNVQELRDAYLDGELSSSMMAEVHAHLLQCPECQQQVEMIRACGNVIANDRSEPAVGAGLAQRVVAALPNMSAVGRVGLVTRRARREYAWKLAVSGSLPAAAAILFFCVLIWPTAEIKPRPTLVRGEAVRAVGADNVVNPTLGLLEGAKQAASDVNRLLEISTHEARQDMRQRLEQAEQLEKTTSRPASIVDVLLQPFTGILDTYDEPVVPGDEPEVVRF